MTTPIHIRILEQSWHSCRRWIIATEGASVQLEIYPKPYSEGVKAYIWAFFVEPEFRGKGIGTQLLKAAEDIAAKEGEPAVWLEWDRRDTPQWTLEWYLRNGYTEVSFGNDKVLLKKKL